MTLDLKVPKGWQMCTTRELEMIAEEMIRAQMMASLSRFHPFDWVEIKTRLFFRFSEVTIVSQYVYDGDETDARYGLTTFVCRHPSLGKETFELQTWQVHSFLVQLKWLDATDDKGRALPMPKLMWPYPTRLRRWWPLWKREYYAPGELMDGMTWQTYRWINDWMETHTMKANAIVAEREKHAKADPKQLKQMQREERELRITILSLIFGCPKWRIRLARFSDVEWQTVMFWWSSMMQYLKGQYPKCFKSSDKNPRSRSKQQPLPIELYTRSTATLQKYLGGLTEDEINAQTAHAILRHLNDMAIEAEEMEKIRRKHN